MFSFMTIVLSYFVGSYSEMRLGGLLVRVVDWPVLVFRVFAIANFVFAGIGLLFLGSSVMGLRAANLGNTSTHPYFLQAFWAMTATNFVFLALLVFGGIRLLQLRTLGVIVCNGVFVAEILYFMSLGFLWSSAFPTTVSMSVAGATGVGSMGVSPQLLCGYPLVALISLNLARRRLTVAKQVV